MTVELIRGHKDFHSRYVDHEGEFLRELAGQRQRPSALYIGCADSRVVPELLTSAAPGDLFVMRNIANLVPPLEHADASVGAGIEYAVGHLQVPHVVVCGHYGCGGIRAVIDGLEKIVGLPSLEEWLRVARPGVERARGLAPATDSEALWRRAVEENVIDQLAHLISFPVVAQALEAGKLELHGWVYDLFSLELQVYDSDHDGFVTARSLIAEKEA